MENTKLKIIKSKKELDEFLLDNDVLNVQALVISSVRESVLVGKGAVTDNTIHWSVWYK